MGTGYTRNDTANNIADGNVINAADFDGEYDAIEAAFNSSTGHTHDGTSAEGAPITVLGPSQEFVATSSEVKPSTNAGLDLGTASLKFKDLYIDGTAYIDGLGGNLLVDTTNALQFRDAQLAINSSADGQLDIAADTTAKITSPEVIVTDDFRLQSDAAILTFGADDDVSVTHVADTGLDAQAASGFTLRLQTGDTTVESGNTIGKISFNAPDEASGTDAILVGAEIEAAAEATFSSTVNSTALVFKTNDSAAATERMRIKSDGDILFKGASYDLTWDTSAHALTTSTSNGDLNITPHGTGSVVITGDLDVDNINIDGNTISSTDTDGNINLTPNGTGQVIVGGGFVPSEIALTSTDGGSTKGPQLDIFRDSASPADGDAIGYIDFSGDDSGNNKTVYASILATAVDVTDTTEDGRLEFNTMVAGTDTTILTVDADGLDVTGTINIDSTSFDPASGWGASQDVSPAGLNFEDNGTTVGNLLGQTYKTDSVTWGTTRLSGFFGMEKTNGTGNGDFVWWLAPTNFAQNPAQKMRIANNGDISFYEDTGTTAKFFWDASAESLGIGTSSPLSSASIHIQGSDGASGAGVNVAANELFVDNNGNTGVTVGTSNTGVGYYAFADSDVALRSGLFYDHSTDDMGFRVASSTRMTIDSSGHLLVGGTSSAGGTDGAALQVKGNTGVTDFSIALIDGDDQMAGRMHLQSTGSNSISIDADPDNLGASTFLGFNVDGTERMRIEANEVVVNEGSHDIDFRVETDSYGDAIFVNAGSGEVNFDPARTNFGGITAETADGEVNMGLIKLRNSNTTSGYFLSIDAEGAEASQSMIHYWYDGAYRNRFEVAGNKGATVVNESGQDVDFRIESDSNANMFRVNAGEDMVYIGGSGNLNKGSGTLRTFEAAVDTGIAIGIGASAFTYGLISDEGTQGDVNIIANAYPANLGSDRHVRIKAGSSGGGGPAEIAKFGNSTGVIFNEDGEANKDFRVESDSDSHLFFCDAGVNQVRITTGGYKAEFESNGDGVRIVTDNTSHTIGMVSGNSFATGANYTFFKATGGTSGNFDIVAHTGGVRLSRSATSWSSLSDSRLKTVTGRYTDAITDVKELDPVKFTWNDDPENTPNVGFLAQSVQGVVPEAVISEQRIEGDDTEYLSVKYTEVMPLLAAALQEAITKIETLETQRADMEARLAALENA